MRLKIGFKLLHIREDRKMTQHEMAEFLAMSPSAYARLERNESTIPFEELNRISEQLQIPIQELLPEIFSIHNSHNGHGLVFGNVIYNHYYDHNEREKELELKIQTLEIENRNLKQKLETI